VCRPYVTGYYASKAAVIKMTSNLVVELAPHGIRINAILPGTLYTEMTKSRIVDEEVHQKIKDSIPLGRIGHVKDLNGMVLYLASNDASSYVTGSAFTIDGGLSC
jgi:NAD(P)-dependent dehydrogenase (short-subunit alcohol dehydrogenase family)